MSVMMLLLLCFVVAKPALPVSHHDQQQKNGTVGLQALCDVEQEKRLTRAYMPHPPSNMGREACLVGELQYMPNIMPGVTSDAVGKL